MGGSSAEAGVVASIRFILPAVLSLPLGALSDRWGGRFVQYGAATAASAHTILVIAVLFERHWPIYIWAVLSGAAAAIYLPASSSRVRELANAEGYGGVFGAYSLALNAGVAFGPAIGGLLIEFVSILAALLFACAAGTIAAAIAAVTHVVNTPPTMSLRQALNMGSLLGDRTMVAGWLCAFAVGTCWGLSLAMFPVFAREISTPVIIVGLISAMQAGVNGFARLPFGLLIDRFRLPRYSMALSCLVYSVMMAVTGVQRNLWAIGALLVIAALVASFTLVAAMVAMAKTTTQKAGIAFGGYNASLAIGLALGPVISGVLAELGGWTVSFGAVALIAAVAASFAGVLMLRGS